MAAKYIWHQKGVSKYQQSYLYGAVAAGNIGVCISNRANEK